MSLFTKVQTGLYKTREKFSKEIKGALGEGKLTEDVLEDLESRLISADICFDVASEITGKVRKESKGEGLSSERLLQYLEEFLAEYLIEAPPPGQDRKPHVILVLGVNGVGKTTSIAKLANFYKDQGKKVIVAAADTFRAGAIEQLEIWCRRAGADIIRHQEKSDAAAVVYDAYAAAKARGHDILIIDTAGRLHNKDNLMQELKKMIRVLKKHGEDLPHETLLVIDGNTGQNAVSQAEAFNRIQPLDGFIVAKLDGTAKGGALVTVNYQMKIPIRWIGVGEGLEDLVPFSRKDYVQGMLGSEEIEIPVEQQAIKEKYKGLTI